mgnify:CR=1 FL=1
MSDVPTPAGAARPTWLRLWAEMLALFVGVPVAMAASFGLYPLFPVILALAGVAVLLLGLTPGFRFRELLRGPVLGEWRLILGFSLAVGLACVVIAAVLLPGQMFWIPLQRPELWVMIMVFYPLLSAVPQELIYRPLFFRRYGGLFPNEGVAVLANAVAFGIGHLFYMNPVTILMTAAAGVIFGWAYLRHRSFLLACVLHAIAGQIVFTVGLGRYFYHGAIGG